MKVYSMQSWTSKFCSYCYLLHPSPWTIFLSISKSIQNKQNKLKRQQQQKNYLHFFPKEQGMWRLLMTENVLCINNMVRNLYHASDINKIVVLHIMHLERFANVCLNRNNRLLSSLYPLNMSTAYCKKLPRILVSFCQTQIRVMGFTEREIFSGVHRTYRSIYYCSCTKHLNFNTPAHFPPPCSG